MSNMHEPITPTPHFGDGITVKDTGLTKLEYATIQIMASVYANSAMTGEHRELAAGCISAARALFAELEKSE